MYTKAIGSHAFFICSAKQSVVSLWNVVLTQSLRVLLLNIKQAKKCGCLIPMMETEKERDLL